MSKEETHPYHPYHCEAHLGGSTYFGGGCIDSKGTAYIEAFYVASGEDESELNAELIEAIMRSDLIRLHKMKLGAEVHRMAAIGRAAVLAIATPGAEDVCLRTATPEEVSEHMVWLAGEARKPEARKPEAGKVTFRNSQVFGSSMTTVAIEKVSAVIASENDGRAFCKLIVEGTRQDVLGTHAEVCEKLGWPT